MPYQFGLADESALDQIYALIDQRIQWMDNNGIRQWNVTDYWGVYPKEHYVEQIHQKHLYVLKRTSDQTVVAVAVLYESDERWAGEQDVPAYYVHHFAADSCEKGAGALLLQHLEHIARRDGKAALRLDCADDNPRLNQYYKQKGYVLTGTCVDGVYHGNKREKLFYREREATPCFGK